MFESYMSVKLLFFNFKSEVANIIFYNNITIAIS